MAKVLQSIIDVVSGATARGIRPTRVDIDLSAVIHNAQIVQRAAGTARLCAVVKADAYGHGAVPVARALIEAGAVWGLAVHLVEEAFELRDAGIAAPIFVMGGALGDTHADIVARELTPLVTSERDLHRFAEVGRGGAAPVAVHLKVDTGMTRLGVSAVRARQLVVGGLPAGVRLVGLCTHMACAEDDDPADPDSITAHQLARFEEVLAAARGAGVAVDAIHAANSAATLRFPAARYTHVRPGLALYGNGAYSGFDTSLRPAMRLRSEILLIHDVPPGTTVSYGATWRAARPSRIAVVPIGYADGVPRRTRSTADVLIEGARCPIVGRVCMDSLMVDVTELGQRARVGAEVVLLGEQAGGAITTAELAARAELSEYEVTCGISKRVPRAYP